MHICISLAQPCLLHLIYSISCSNSASSGSQVKVSNKSFVDGFFDGFFGLAILSQRRVGRRDKRCRGMRIQAYMYAICVIKYFVAVYMRGRGVEENVYYVDTYIYQDSN
jgi:hypothetical protein